MPYNFDALLRYHVIDECLQNNRYGCTLDFLAEKCTEALIEKGGNPGRSTVSKRTIQYDISEMRGSSLGYKAPIMVRDGKYFYSDKDFRISNATITRTDIHNISAALKMLKTYRGTVFFRNLESLVERLEQKIITSRTARQVQAVLAFEHIPESTGVEWIIPLLDAILKKQVVSITYQPFGAKKHKKFPFHPCLLKEYRNRWYLLGMNNRHKCIQTLALDRIKDFEMLPDFEYDSRQLPDHDTYFKHTIGVSISYGSKPQEIVLKFNESKLPYIKTQSLHESQEIIAETLTSITIRLHLIQNYELESLIMSFADEVEVLQPPSLRKAILRRLRKAAIMSRRNAQKSESQTKPGC